MNSRPVFIAPSIIAADFGNLHSELARTEKARADMLHVDIMDGHFVPNITFGPDITKTMKSLTRLPLDVHLMISQPRKYVVGFAEAGAANITFHVEAEGLPLMTINEIKSFNVKVGLAIKPRTPLSEAQYFLAQIDRLLIMTVEPGFGGQKFMPEMMEKVKEAAAIRKEKGYHYDIEVDGGLDQWTTVTAVQAGADVIVAGTSVYKNPDLPVAIQAIRDAAGYARYHSEE